MALQEQGMGFFVENYVFFMESLGVIHNPFGYYTLGINPTKVKIPKKFIPPKPNSGVYKDFYE